MGKSNIPAAQTSSDLIASGAMSQKPIDNSHVNNAQPLTSHQSEGNMAAGSSSAGQSFSTSLIENNLNEAVIVGKDGLQTGLEGASIDSEGLSGTFATAGKDANVLDAFGQAIGQHAELQNIDKTTSDFVNANSLAGHELSMQGMQADLVKRSNTIVNGKDSVSQGG